MIKKLLSSTALFVLFFSFSSTSSFAACGDWGTVGGCGSYGGCESAGEVCVRLGNFRYECQDSPACENSDQSQNRCGRLATNDKCGPANGCREGFMCSNDNGDNPRCVTPTSGHPSCDTGTTNLGCGDITQNPTLACGCTESPSEGQLVPLSAATAGYCCGWAHINGCYGSEAEHQAAVDNGQTENPPPEEVERLSCGEKTNNANQPCGCAGAPQGPSLATLDNGTQYCCGWKHRNGCYSTQSEYRNAVTHNFPNNPGEDDPPSGGGGGGGGTTAPTPTPNNINIFDGPTSENFRQLNPLVMFGNEDAQALTSPGAIVSRLLLFAFPLAGLILFVMIVWGGFEMLTSAASKGIEAGKQRVTAAIVGFFLLFIAYWIFQMVEVIFGVVIL